MESGEKTFSLYRSEMTCISLLVSPSSTGSAKSCQQTNMTPYFQSLVHIWELAEQGMHGVTNVSYTGVSYMAKLQRFVYKLCNVSYTLRVCIPCVLNI